MEEDADKERGEWSRSCEEGIDSCELWEMDDAVPDTCIGVLIRSLCQYQDVYPVLLRGVQSLSRELRGPSVCCRDAKGPTDTCYAKVFIAIGALNKTVEAMLANLDAPEFTSPCLEILVTLMGHAGDLIATALARADILTIMEKIMHNVIYLDEPMCVQYGVQLLSGLAAHSHSVDLERWNHLVGTTAQAMLTNAQSNSLARECVLCLDRIFRLGAEFAVPTTAANIILKKLDQWNQRPTGLDETYFTAAVSVLFRVIGIAPDECWTPHLVFAASVLAGALDHYQTHRMLGKIHEGFVEKLVQMPLADVVPSSIKQLRTCQSLGSEDDILLLHTAAVKLELAVIWRERAHDFLTSHGMEVLAKAFVSRGAMENPSVETSMAASMYRVSSKYADDLWNEIQVDSINLSTWVEELAARCEECHDKSVNYILCMMLALLQCEGFRESLIKNGGSAMLESVFRERQLLPDSARTAIAILASTARPNSATTPSDLLGMIAEAMTSYGTDDPVQLDCAKMLVLLSSQQGGGETPLSDQNIQNLVRAMNSNLGDRVFIAEMLHAVANTLAKTKGNARVLFSEQGILRVISKAVSMHSWGPGDDAGTNAHAIICEVAHKLDVIKTLSTLESQSHFSDNLSLKTTVIPTDALEECCYMIGALASVKSLLPELIQGNVILHLVGMLSKMRQESSLSDYVRFVRISSACFFVLKRIVNAPDVMLFSEKQKEGAKCKGIDSHDVQARLINCNAYDVILGCLEESMGFAIWPSVLVDRGCQLLHGMLVFAIPLPIEAQDRWLSVAVLILQKGATQREMSELVFATTLVVLARGDRSARGEKNHVDMLKAVLQRLDVSLQDERRCTLSPVECAGAVRVIEAVVAASGVLANLFVSRCLGILGKLMRALVLSTTHITDTNLGHCERSILLLASHDYLNGLTNRLESAVTVLEVPDSQLEPDEVLPVAEDFRALAALLLSNQAKKLLAGIAYHRLCVRLAVIAEHIDESMTEMGLSTNFFRELGCLASRLLPVSQREQIINASLCHFAENNAWHSMRWIIIATDRDSSEMMLITEFLLLRIVSGYSVCDQALLVELLQGLTFLLLRGECSDIVEASPHSQDLPGVLWGIVRDELRHPSDDPTVSNLAAAVLEAIAVTFSAFHGELLSINPNESDGEDCVDFCLQSLSRALSSSDSSLSSYMTTQGLLQSTRTVLQHCIRLGGEHVRTIIQHPITHRIMELSYDVDARENGACQHWFLTILTAIVQSHGLLYAEKLLAVFPNSAALLVDLVQVVIKEEHFLQWKHFDACLSIARETTPGVNVQMNCFELFADLRQQSKRLVCDQKSVVFSRGVRQHVSESIARLSVMYGRASVYNPHAIRGCLEEIGLSGIALLELFCSALSFDVQDYSTLATLHLKMARLAVAGGAVEVGLRDESVAALRQMMSPVGISDQALAEYIDLVASMSLAPPMKPDVCSLINASETILVKTTARLISGATRSLVLEKSLLHLLSLLQATLADQWSNSEVDGVLQLLEIFGPDNASQSVLLESVLALPQGLPQLFELARDSPSDVLQGDILAFIFQRIPVIRHKTQRIGELEMSVVLSLIKKTLSNDAAEIPLGIWRAMSGSEMLRCALDVLKLFVRLKHAAQLCSNLGGVEILFEVLRAPSQREAVVHLGLEICCYLAGHGVNLTNESAASLLQDLLVLIDTRVGALQVRLGFLVLELASALEAHALNLGLIQRCRTQIVSIASRSSEEAAMLTQNLYTYRQRLLSGLGYASGIDCKTTPDLAKHAQTLPRTSLQGNEIRSIILSSCQRIVQCAPAQPHGGTLSYVDLQTSEKSDIEPLVYIQLREAVEQLRIVLDDPDVVSDGGFVFDLIPALCEILELHTITTPLIHTVMQILAQVAFVNPSSIANHYRVDMRALLASLSLHERESLPFALAASRFSNSIAMEHRSTMEDESLFSMLALQIEIVQDWQNDAEVVDQCLSSICSLLEAMEAGGLRQLKCGDILELLNRVSLQQTAGLSMTWVWLKCVTITISRLDRVASRSVLETARATVKVIWKFTRHHFVVDKALRLLGYIYREKKYLTLQDFVVSDGVEVLLICIKMHSDDDNIVSTCLEILVATALTPSSSREANVRLVKEVATTLLLAICRKQIGNALVCRMCLEVVRQMIASLESDRHESKLQRFVAPSGDHPEKAELLSNVLEAGSISLLFDLLGSYASHCSDRLLDVILGVLSELTQVEQGRKLVETCHGLKELQQTTARLWETQVDSSILELAFDCLVNLACSDQTLNHSWKELSMWLLKLAESIQVANPTGMCVEKIVGVLGRLAVDSEVRKIIAQSGAFSLTRLLANVGEDRFLECAIYGLLSMLCEDTTNVQSLMVFDLIPIAAERICCLVGDEEALMSSLNFFSLFILNSGEGYLALQDECVFEALELVVQKYPVATVTQVNRIASSLLERVSALEYQSSRTKPAHAKRSLDPGVLRGGAEKSFQSLLQKGARFRVRWGDQQGNGESVDVKMAISADYLLFRRPESSVLPRVERVFVSQLQVCAQRSLTQSPKTEVTLSPTQSKRTFSWATKQDSFEGDRILHLKIREEDVLLKAASVRERVCWEQGFQWLVARRDNNASVSPSL